MEQDQAKQDQLRRSTRETGKSLEQSIGCDYLTALSLHVGAWANANFDDKHALSPALGLSEEVGELCEALQINPVQQQAGRASHHQLKHIQNIRMDTNHRQEFFKAMNFLGEMAPGGEIQVDFLDDTLRDPDGDINVMKAQDSVGDIVVFLADLCYRNGWNFGEIVQETWAEVCQRNWKVSPNDAHKIAEQKIRSNTDDNPQYHVKGSGLSLQLGN